MSSPRLLDDALLTRFETSLRSVGIAVDDLRPGLTNDEIDALTEPEDLYLPDETRAWWRWRNGSPARRRLPILPTREMLSLQEAIDLKRSLPGEGERRAGALLPIEGPPHYMVECSRTGPVAAPVVMSLDWATGIDRQIESFGELVWTWIGHLERGLWIPDPAGGWSDYQPMFEERFPDDVEAAGVW